MLHVDNTKDVNPSMRAYLRPLELVHLVSRKEQLSSSQHCVLTEIPTIIDPVALGRFIVALESIIVGNSVSTMTLLPG